jgi:hypothetical protein
VELQDFARVNLFAGQNNVGKTGLLEALFLHCGAYNPALTIKLYGFKGIESLKLEFGKWAETPFPSYISSGRVCGNPERFRGGPRT